MSKENIFLMGFMSAGKSKIGRQLAKKLNREFVDLDQLIEVRLNKSISKIFEEEGEAYFRKAESEILAGIEANSSLIISLGGGTPCYSDNLSLIKERGISVYLKIDEGILIGRLRQNTGNRPLLRDLDPDQISGFVETKLNEREPYYLKAEMVMNDNNPTVAKLIQLLRLN